MKGYLTYCYCKQDSARFEKLDEKVDPDFQKGTYSICHHDIRERIQIGDFLFLRTNWRDTPYIIGYYEISKKCDGRFGPVLVAKNRICINFNLEINPELLEFLRPGKSSKPKNISWAQYVNYALGHRKYIVLEEGKTKSLATLIKQSSWE